MVGEVVGKSSGASFILERRLAAVVKHDHRPGFFVDLAHKDLGLALDLAAEAGARADLVTEARRLYAEASKAGLGKLDSSGLLAMLEPKSLT
jgi:3-hydroxyisobutyrate dehydrogenase-like beta-hydroxyacid dehydrogenase